MQEYEYHPEAKCADANGDPCSKQTIGLLQRRHIRWIGQIKYIGKESNALEDVQSGVVHSEQSVYTEYPDPRRDEWQTKILPILKQIPLNFLVVSCAGKLSRRALIDLRAKRSKPHPKTEKYSQILRNCLFCEMNRSERTTVMPYKNPEDKRRWEHEHRAERNAQRRTRRSGRSHSLADLTHARELGSTEKKQTKNGWKSILGFAIGLGIVLAAVLGTVGVPNPGLLKPDPKAF